MGLRLGAEELLLLLLLLLVFGAGTDCCDGGVGGL